MFVSRKKFNQAKEAAAKLLDEVEKLQDRAFLVSIQRKGRMNIMTFARNGKIYQVETMGRLADETPEWRKNLLE